MATRDELYAKFGVTAEAAQLFETDLGTLLLAIEGYKKGWHLSPNRASATEFYEKMNRKTLGQLLLAVKVHVDFDDVVETKFQEGLAARNRLNHGFYERHNFAIQSDEGRDIMMVDLEALHCQLFDAWQVAQALSDILTDVLSKGQQFSS